MSTITQRIASAFVVLCGRYGDVTKMAHDREQSRQSLYREASQVANAVDGTAVQSRIDELQRQLAGQQAQIQDLQERLEHAIEITRDKQDEFASVAQAEGVSLSVARRLLQVVAGSVTTPSVPTLGRATEEAGQLRRPVARSDRRGGPTQGQTGHRRRNFFGPKPVLMLVEPGSLCWVGGRMVEARDGPTWAVEFARFSALSGVVRDDGSGLGKGLKLERARRRAAGQPDLEDSLDIFHTFREGGRALRKTWSGGRRAGASRGGPEGVGPVGRAGESRTGHATSTSRLWRQAEGLWDQAMAAERAWKLTRSAFEFFTPEGRFNDRQQAQAVVAAALRHLSGPALGQDPAVVAPPRVHVPGPSERRLAELGLDPDVLSALLDLEGLQCQAGDCRSQRPGQPRHGLGRWPARSNWRRQNPTGRN